ncbi:MAG: alpha/beta fold hydrolase, partial [Brevibacterium aurantiacum]
APPMRELLLSSTLDFVKRGSPLPKKLRADEWAAITVPSQVVIAGNSQFVPRRALRTLRRHAPGIDVHVLDGIGHAVLSDAPEEADSIVEELITKFDER